MWSSNKDGMMFVGYTWKTKCMENSAYSCARTFSV